MTRTLTVHILSAFAAAAGGGNLAGVVPAATGLEPAVMQAVARRLGLSETVFILPGETGEFRLRFFTPVTEVDLCGHATVAAWALLHQQGRIAAGDYRQDLAAGTLAVQVHADGRVSMDQPLPAFGPCFAPADLAPLLGLEAAELAEPGLPVQAVSTGLLDILVPVRSRARLAALCPDYPRLAAFNAATGTIGIHAFCPQPEGRVADASCRNFAPHYGIDEEAATGSSSGALACYLHRYRPGRQTYAFDQGRELGRPSRIFVKLETAGRALSRVAVSGYARWVETRRLAL